MTCGAPFKSQVRPIARDIAEFARRAQDQKRRVASKRSIWMLGNQSIKEPHPRIYRKVSILGHFVDGGMCFAKGSENSNAGCREKSGLLAMENMNDLCRRLERAQASQRGRRRLPVRGSIQEFMERLVSRAGPSAIDGAGGVDAGEWSQQTPMRLEATSTEAAHT